MMDTLLALLKSINIGLVAIVGLVLLGIKELTTGKNSDAEGKFVALLTVSTIIIVVFFAFLFAVRLLEFLQIIK
jgi:hypothetical protein